jgi:hypothetical protein
MSSSAMLLGKVLKLAGNLFELLVDFSFIFTIWVKKTNFPAVDSILKVLTSLANLLDVDNDADEDH